MVKTGFVNFFLFGFLPFLSFMMGGKLNCIAPGQKEALQSSLVFRSGLHNRESAEGLPQLFCDCFIELHLLFQVEADDTVVIVDPVTVEVIHLSL